MSYHVKPWKAGKLSIWIKQCKLDQLMITRCLHPLYSYSVRTGGVAPVRSVCLSPDMKNILVGTQTCEILEYSRADNDVITKPEGKTLSELNMKVSHHVSLDYISKGCCIFIFLQLFNFCSYFLSFYSQLSNFMMLTIIHSLHLVLLLIFVPRHIFNVWVGLR